MPLLTWEKINDNGYEYRARVHGGWLVKILEDVIQDRHEYGQGLVSGWDWRIAVCFVPDPNHEWR